MYISRLNQLWSDKLPAFFTRPRHLKEAQQRAHPHYCSFFLFFSEHLLFSLWFRAFHISERRPQSFGPINATKNSSIRFKLNVQMALL